MPWRLKFCQPLSGVFGAYTPRARHRAKFDVGFFVALRGPPQTPIGAEHNGRATKTTFDRTTQEEYHGTERRTNNGTKSADG